VDQSAAPRIIYIVSDASGERASNLILGALEQFSDVTTVERRCPDVRLPAEIARITHAAAKEDAMVVFTFAREDMRATARTAAEGLGVPYIDLFEPVIPALEKWLGKEPRNRPGHVFDKKYFNRIAAIDFATAHDDGKRVSELEKAEVVVLGASRSSKSPVCLTLASHRIFAANVPIVPNVDLPPIVNTIDPRRVYVLKIALDRLIEVRKRRLDRLGAGENDPYVDRDSVKEERRRINRLLADHPGWTPVEVTHRGIEETAALIMAKHQEKFP